TGKRPWIASLPSVARNDGAGAPFAGHVHREAGSSEIEVRVVAGGRHAGDAVGQQAAHDGPRLDAGVPVPGHRVVIPGDVAQVVDAGKVRGGGEIGEAELLARQPVAPLGQPGDVGEVMVDVV